MSLEFNPENRNANPSRRCSFCRRPGHNITRCNSESIHIFESETRNYINIIMPLRLGGLSYLESVKQHLLNEALNKPNLVRAFAVSKCGASTRINSVNCVQLIIQYFMPQIQNVETMNRTVQDVRDSVQPQSDETQPTEPSQRTGRRFGFSESMYGTGFQGFLSRDSESILYAMMFIEMVRTINQSNSLNRKFDIKTSVLEIPVNLEQKCECGICYEECETKNIVKLNCGHEFCKDCIKQTLQNERRLTSCCAFCRTDIKNIELKLESIKDEFNELIE